PADERTECQRGYEDGNGSRIEDSLTTQIRDGRAKEIRYDKDEGNHDRSNGDSNRGTLLFRGYFSVHLRLAHLRLLPCSPLLLIEATGALMACVRLRSAPLTL